MQDAHVTEAGMSYNLAKDLETVGILSLAPGATHLLHMADDSKRYMQNILLLKHTVYIHMKLRSGHTNASERFAHWQYLL